MSEDKATCNVSPEESQEAMDMLDVGYDQPTVVIEPPRTITARHNGRMVEIEEPAWVKFSTDFKKELKTLDVYSLKVFIYIGLSVNFKTGTAWPGLRKIAEDTGIDKDTAAKAVENLESRGFMTIQKRDGNSNIYKPTRYISIGTVRPEGTPAGSELSDANREPSDKTPELSDAQKGNLHNKNNKNKQEKRDSDSEIFTKLSELTGGGLNSNTPKFVDAWLERHTPARILEAIQISKDNKARSTKYVDEILLSWEANGYPKTREERVAERKAKQPPSAYQQIKNILAEQKAERELSNVNA